MKKYDVLALADLSMLHFDKCEMKDIEESLDGLLSLAEMLEKVDIECGDCSVSRNNKNSTCREDTVCVRTLPDDIMSCSAYVSGPYISVPQVVEGE